MRGSTSDALASCVISQVYSFTTKTSVDEVLARRAAHCLKAARRGSNSTWLVSTSADPAFEGEQYCLMRVHVDDTLLQIEAFHVDSSTELPVVATLTARTEMMRTYQGLGEQERYINLQVQFAGFAVVDVDEGGVVYQAVSMMG